MTANWGGRSSATLLTDGLTVIDKAVQEHKPSSLFGLFSGGHDSVCSTYVASRHPSFTGAVHLNTGTGIKATRAYVGETCDRYGWKLTEYEPQTRTYQMLVLARGMPGGPKAHNSMYFYLKQQSINRLVREYKKSLHDRVMLVTGIRSDESERRMTGLASRGDVDRRGSQVWVSPILDWTALETTHFMAEMGIPRNPVVVKLHRSGECLCGALAQKRELRYAELFYPDDVAPIRQLERECAAKGLSATWGVRAGKKRPENQVSLPLCWSCDGRWDYESKTDDD